jgi:hypothetical protein
VLRLRADISRRGIDEVPVGALGDERAHAHAVPITDRKMIFEALRLLARDEVEWRCIDNRRE